MPWYAAHAIMYVKFADGNQDKYPIWENVILIEAESIYEAWKKAEQKAREDENETDEHLNWDGRSGSWKFGGIQKLTSCADSKNRPINGTIITYVQMRVNDEKTLQELVEGLPVKVLRYKN